MKKAPSNDGAFLGRGSGCFEPTCTYLQADGRLMLINNLDQGDFKVQVLAGHFVVQIEGNRFIGNLNN